MANASSEHRQSYLPHVAPLSRLQDNTFANAESFEAREVPQAWRTAGGGSLSIATAHYKHGLHSLQWDWQVGSRLIITNPYLLKEAGESKLGGMKIWIYSEKALDDRLVIRIGSAADMEARDPRYMFTVGVNFTGWRCVWVRFRQDAANPSYKGDAAQPLEVVEIAAPTKAEQGRYFFDIVEFSVMIPEMRSADYQVPYIIHSTDDGKGDMWDRTHYHSTIEPPPPAKNEVTPEEAEAFRTIMKRLDHWIYGTGKYKATEPYKIRYEALQKFIADGVSKFPGLDIKRHPDGRITGAPFFSSRDPHGPEFGYAGRGLFFPLVYDYKLNGNEKSKEKLFDLFDHLHDQGWAEGSGLGTLDHETNRNSGYFFGVYMMRDELAATGRLEREIATMRWFGNFGKTYGVHGDHYLEINADEVRTRYMYKLMTVLLAEDSPEKVRDMECLVRWMNQGLKIAPGYAGTIKSDYMGYHHRGVYMNAYVPQALHAAALMIYLLRDTPFALSEEAVNNVRQALLTLRTICHKYDVPIGLSGRFPNQLYDLVDTIPGYAYLALASEPADEEMAAAFMRLWEPESPVLKSELFQAADADRVDYLHTLGGLEILLDLAAQGIQPEKDPRGFWVKPTAALAVLRRDHWMASVKGFSQYVFDFEGHAPEGYETGRKPRPGENVFGRYVSYGVIQLFTHGHPINAADSGYALDHGWDWNRWPGATTKHLPFDDLRIVERTVNTRNFSDQTFVGGVTSGGQRGLFAMKFHDRVFDPTFYANKSVFVFDRELVVLGSDIKNSDTKHRTETTLFQAYLRSEDAPVYINGPEPVTDLPYDYTVDGEKPVWLVDPSGNGYVLPNAKGLRLRRAEQQSIHHMGEDATSGNYATAWIDHGTAPNGASYAYILLPQASVEEVEAYAKAPQVEILRQDSRAHIVRHTPSGAIGYAVFDETLELNAGALRKTSMPAMVFEQPEEGRLRLSVAEPDLRLVKKSDQRMSEKEAWTAGTPATLHVELHGQWRIIDAGLAAVNICQCDQGNTTLELSVRDGVSLEVMLEAVDQ